jgi:hypothetical protein
MLKGKKREKMLNILEKDLRHYMTETEWEEYIPKLLDNLTKVFNTRYLESPIEYIHCDFFWDTSKEGYDYWVNFCRIIDARVEDKFSLERKD